MDSDDESIDMKNVPLLSETNLRDIISNSSVHFGEVSCKQEIDDDDDDVPIYNAAENDDLLTNSNVKEFSGWLSKYNISPQCKDELLEILRQGSIPGLEQTTLPPSSTVVSLDNTTSFAIQCAMQVACQKAVDKVEERNRTLLLHLNDEMTAMRGQIAELKKAAMPIWQPTELPKKPFDNVDEFMRFESRLRDNPDKIRLLKMDLKKISNSKSKKFVTTAWRYLITDSAAENLCWRGTEQKHTAKTLHVTRAIRDVFVMEVGGNEEDFVAASKAYFQYAKSRKQLTELKNSKAK